MTRAAGIDDICLILEGAYPFVAGGVSSWTHDLIRAHPDLRFHILALSADDKPQALRYDLPANVTGLTVIALQQPDARLGRGRGVARMIAELDGPLTRLLARGGFADFRGVCDVLRRHQSRATRAALMNSAPAFDLVGRMYEASVPGSSFMSYFWSWRVLVGGLFSVLLAKLPPARCYHAISTGYAGLAMARAVVETGRPGLLTEHGIYTNERRVEIEMAEWLTDGPLAWLDLEGRRRDLRDVWTDAFLGYSRACYEASRRIVTLYTGNQQMQLRDGAPAERMAIIPNGIDYDGFSAIARDTAPRPPTVALIGRAVPIKDVKTFIRAVALLREMVPGCRALLLGPTDEDPVYFRECQEMVAHLGLGDCFEFAGRVKLHDHLGRIDVVALTSISEAQPLVLLEAGAAGVPSVATDVGSCRDLIEGRADEDPPFGPGGFVVPLANPQATARAMADLLGDPALRALARQDSLNAGLRSQVHAVAVTSGPWLLTVLALGAVEAFAGDLLGRDTYRLFSTIVVYNFAFSIVLAAPVVMVATRLLADMLYARDVSEATGLLVGSLGVVFALLAAVGLPFYGFVVEMAPAERVLAFTGFLLIGGVWVVTAFLSALKSYGSITLAFAIGMGGGGALAAWLAPEHGPLGLLAGFTAGLALLLYGLVARVLLEYPAPAIRPLAILPAMLRYRELALVGLLLGAAIWVDKWIMWFAPGRVVVAGAMATHPTYDSAMFLACLTMAPAAAMFLVVVETRFYERYLGFYRSVAGHATAQEIARDHASILRTLNGGFRQVAVLQAVVCYVAVLAAPGLIGMARGGVELVPTFRFGVLGAACHGLLLFVVAILSYFDLRRELIVIGAVFLVLNASLTIAVQALGIGYAGYGYFLAALLSLALAYALAARRLFQLPYMTFVANNRSLR